MTITIRHVKGSRIGREQIFTGGLLTIGRSPDNNIVFDGAPEDDSVSANHAELVMEGSVLTLRDRNSTNGTFVNGQRVDRRVLSNMDQVSLGMSGPAFQVLPTPTIGATVPEPHVPGPSPQPAPLPAVGQRSALGRSTVFLRNMVNEAVRATARKLKLAISLLVVVILMSIGVLVFMKQHADQELADQKAKADLAQKAAEEAKKKVDEVEGSANRTAVETFIHGNEKPLAPKPSHAVAKKIDERYAADLLKKDSQGLVLIISEVIVRFPKGAQRRDNATVGFVSAGNGHLLANAGRIRFWENTSDKSLATLVQQAKNEHLELEHNIYVFPIDAAVSKADNSLNTEAAIASSKKGLGKPTVVGGFLSYPATAGNRLSRAEAKPAKQRPEKGEQLVVFNLTTNKHNIVVATPIIGEVNDPGSGELNKISAPVGGLVVNAANQIVGVYNGSSRYALIESIESGL